MSSTLVFITGANQGLGYEMALNLSQREGFHILVGARRADAAAEAIRKIQAAGAKSPLEFVHVDISSPDSIAAAAKTITEKYGRLDVLINNAGVTLEPIHKGTLRELWEGTFRVNVFGTAELTEALLPLLEKAEYPRVINVSSTMGSIDFQLTPNTGFPVEELTVYDVSKAALSSVTAHHSLKLKNKNGVVLSVCPGYNATNINGYPEGAQHPSVGAAGVLRYVLAPQGTYKTGAFWNDKGEPVKW